MHPRIFALTGALGALAVIVGAFGAHGLEGWAEGLPDGPERLAWWDTATDYLFWTLPLLLGLGLLEDRAPSKLHRAGVGLAMAGLVLFSGSLYAMTLSGVRILGAITPFGGTALIAAWICFAVGAFRARSP